MAAAMPSKKTFTITNVTSQFGGSVDAVGKRRRQQAAESISKRRRLDALHLQG
jgi:hypothetical protein